MNNITDRIELKAGQQLELAASTGAKELVIAESAGFTAPEGKLVTLVVDGVETAITPGAYSNAVLEVTESFSSPVEDFDDKDFRVALYIDENGVNDARSAASALKGGSYDSKGMDSVSISSTGPLFGGVVVTGKGKYDIKNLSIAMTGHGGNDFSGKGTSLLFSGDARVTVDGLRMENRGVIRNAITVGDRAQLTVKNADIMAWGESFERQEELSKNLGMSGVPWMLGLYGNNRATNIVGKGKARYIDSKIRAERWGALSTDGVDTPRIFGDYCVELVAENCDVEITGDSGYGSYSIGACRNTFDNCRVNVPDYALILANEYAAGDFINGTVVNSGRFGLMWHQNQGGVMNIKDATINSKKTSFLVKGCYPDIRVERSVLNPDNGVILQLMDLDDPGMPADGFEVDNVEPVKIEYHNPTGANFHSFKMFTFDLKEYCTDLKASFKDMTVTGDFYNSTTNECPVGMVFPEMPEGEEPPAPPEDGERGHMGPPPDRSSECPVNMLLSFEATEITGVISSSIAKHSVTTISSAARSEMGEVTNTVAQGVNNGVVVTLDPKSRWTVTGDCFFSGLNIAAGAVITAPEGKTLSFIANGTETPAAPGSYKGSLSIKIS